MGVIDRLVRAVVASDIPLDRTSMESAVRELVAVEAPLAAAGTVGRVVDAVVGLGPVEELLRDDAVTDVLVNGPHDVWVERHGVLEQTDVRYADDQELVAAVRRVISPLGLRIDRSAPTVDARLTDGSRIHAVLPPVAVHHPVVAVRRFVPQIRCIADLIVAGGADPDQADLLRSLVEDRSTILVSGGTGAGKTTLLNVLSSAIPRDERTVVIEDAAELRLDGHVVRLEGRPPNTEGVGAVSLAMLLRSALRLRPDRIVVGEVRGPEALDLVAALNTGHRGSMATIHANSPDEALWRLETLALTAADGLGPEAVGRQIDASVDAVVQVERASGRRRVTDILVRSDLR